MRERVLRDLASRAVSDRDFLKRMRRDLEGTLALHGYDLKADELEALEDLRRRTASLDDRTLAGILAGGLGTSTGPPSRPAPPGGLGKGLARPGTPRGPGGPGRGPLRPRRTGNY